MKNLIIRALTGAIFVTLIIGSIWFSPYLFLLLFCLIVGFSIWEFHGLVKYTGNAPLKRVISSTGGTYFFFASFVYANGLSGGSVFLPYMMIIMLIFIFELYDKNSNPITNWAYTCFSQIYCAGSFSLLNFITSVPDTPGEVVYNPLFALVLFVFVWVNDTGAYLVGSTFGKHRLFERISPKKSWEGFWGGLVITILSSLLFAYFIPEIRWYNWLGLSVFIVLFGTLGDLIESLLKRSVGVKDSGNVLPGHGGMLDRFDSVIMAIPAMYIYIELFIRN